MSSLRRAGDGGGDGGRCARRGVDGLGELRHRLHRLPAGQPFAPAQVVGIAARMRLRGVRIERADALRAAGGNEVPLGHGGVLSGDRKRASVAMRPWRGIGRRSPSAAGQAFSQRRQRRVARVQRRGVEQRHARIVVADQQADLGAAQDHALRAARDQRGDDRAGTARAIRRAPCPGTARRRSRGGRCRGRRPPAPAPPARGARRRSR